MLSVIVENGGHGGESAAPIAQAILQKYFVDRGVVKEPKVEEDKLEEENPALENPELAKLEVKPNLLATQRNLN